MRKNTADIMNTFKLALVALFVALAGVQSPGASAQTPAGPTQLAASSASDEAKRVLGRLSSYDLKALKKSVARDRMLRAIDALQAVADNTSKRREPTLIAEFKRAVKSLRAVRPQGGGGTSADTRECDDSYTRCMELAKETGADPKICSLGNEGCYMTKLAIEMTKNPLDPTP